MTTLCFFFFKQKTAYEMLRSLVGSEMCIRDRPGIRTVQQARENASVLAAGPLPEAETAEITALLACLLYTSDAADDLLCVDLGGRRIIKKKKPNSHNS